MQKFPKSGPGEVYRSADVELVRNFGVRIPSAIGESTYTNR
jgi:hypothetical protein